VKEGDHLKHLDMRVMIIFKWIVSKKDDRVWTGVSWLTTGPLRTPPWAFWLHEMTANSGLAEEMLAFQGATCEVTYGVFCTSHTAEQ
jgi:hypothetical protein